MHEDIDPTLRSSTKERVDDGPSRDGPRRPRTLRILYVGLPAFTDSFAQDLLEEIMRAEPSIEVAAVTTPAPDCFLPLSQFSSVEFVQKDDFEFIERIEKLHEKCSFNLSRALLEKHFKSEYAYLSISDRRSLTDVPVRKRHRAYRQLLAYWYDFLTSRKIDAVIVLGYPHAGWNNILVDVAQALSLKVVLMDFTVIRDTTLVSEVERLHEDVPRKRYENLTVDQIRSAIRQDLLERISAPLFGIDFSNNVKAEVQKGSGSFSYFSLLAGLLRNPMKQVRPSITRLSGGLSHFSMALKIFRAKRHVEFLASVYSRISIEKPDLKNPYIYFPLHMQPERSTMPNGGIFEDQLLIAEILSASLPDGWVLYIKEHPSQFWQTRAIKQAWFRDEAYYRRLMALPNTELISLDHSSHDLIKNAKIVATVTGTAGWEALVGNKPCIAFGKPWYSGCNACFSVSSVEECKSAISTAVELSEADIERAVLEFLLHYSDRILSVPFLPDRTQLSKADYEKHTGTLTKAVLSAIGGQDQVGQARRDR